ncbi:hypothetical protein R1sor_011148 [Riccia sorocarpa]|uniref:Uncharacterized protein n=1 Tax=Riccia sorocarpa TaxID=122646 RepID=A0ABD3I2S9_9MARC
MDVWMHRRHSVTGGGVSESGNSGNDSGVQTPSKSRTRSASRPQQEDPETNEEEGPFEQPAAQNLGGRSLPPDAAGVSNSGKRKKISGKPDVVVEAISGFSSQLVDIEKSRQQHELDHEERDRLRQCVVDDRETTLNCWQMEMEEHKILAAEHRADEVCHALEVQAVDSSMLIGMMCAIQTVLEYLEEEDDLLGSDSVNRARTGTTTFIPISSSRWCYPGNVLQFFLTHNACTNGS